MKKNKFILIVLFSILFQSCCPLFGDCDRFDEGLTESNYTPIFLDRADFETSVKISNSTAIGTSGKIYIVNNTLFINELNKGFHIYDNSDPSNPKALKFLEAPGSTDLAIRDNMIYINQANDLIAVQFNQATNEISLKKRIANTFPPLRSPDGFESYNTPENSVVVDWKPRN